MGNCADMEMPSCGAKFEVRDVNVPKLATHGNYVP